MSRASAWRQVLLSPYVLLTLCYLFWAGNTVFARGAADVMPPMNLAFWRWSVAIVVLVPFAGRALWRERHIYVRHWKLIVLLGLAGLLGFNAAIYYAVQYTTAIQATLITSAIPAASMIASWLVYRDGISAGTAIGMAIASLGVLVVISGGSVEALGALAFNRGDLIALLAVVSWTIYSVGLKALPPGLHPLGFLLAILIVGWASVVPFYALELNAGMHAALTWGNVAGVIYLGVFASIVAFVFFNRGVVELGPTGANVFNYLMPLFSGVLAVGLLGEDLRWFHGVSLALTFTGIYLAQKGRRRVPA